MIPTGWHLVHRPADGEHVGYLVPDGSPDRVVPVTLVGSALGPAQDPATAIALLEGRGLTALDRRWWCRLPVPLTDGTDAAEPGTDWAWCAVLLVEAAPDGCRVRLEHAAPAELRAQARLPVPVGDLLREHPPE
ncbi:MAG TPA: hypothetical protein VGB58_07835 [Blastococcus sp.]